MIKPFFLVLILAAGLRFANLTFDSLWLDESYQTVIEAYGNGAPDLLIAQSKPFLFKPGEVANCKSVLANFRKVDPLCPPFYAILINRWLVFFGGSDFALRSFSVLCSLLSIVAVYVFGSLVLDKRSALYAALWQAISPFDIFYAQEARMYSLVALCAILAGASLLYLRFKRSAGNLSNSLLFAFIYVVSTWALINTHYTQLSIWCSFVILMALLVSISRKNLLTLGWLATCNFCVLILSIPWVSFFSQVAALRNASFYVVRESSLFWPLWALFIRLPFNWLTFLTGKKVMLWAVPSYLTSAWLVAYSPLAVLHKFGHKSWQSVTRHFPVLLTLIFWAVMPAVIVWLLDVVEMRKVIEIPRYLMGTAPAVFLIAGYSAMCMENKKYFSWLLVAHTILCLANNAYMHVVPQRENWRTVAQTIEHVCQAHEAVLVCPYYNIVCLDRYLHYPLRQLGIGPEVTQSKFKSIIYPAKTFWLVTAQQGDTIFNIIPPAYKIVQKYDFPHALHLREYALSPE